MNNLQESEPTGEKAALSPLSGSEVRFRLFEIAKEIDSRVIEWKYPRAPEEIASEKDPSISEGRWNAVFGRPLDETFSRHGIDQILIWLNYRHPPIHKELKNLCSLLIDLLPAPFASAPAEQEEIVVIAQAAERIRQLASELPDSDNSQSEYVSTKSVSGKSRQEIYERLLCDFQAGHAAHGQALLELVLLTEDEIEERKQRQSLSLIEVDGYLSWDDPESGEPLFVVVTAPGAVGNGGEFGKNIYQCAQAAWEVFKPLAREAGAHLPTSLRKAMPVEPHDPAGIWYTFLFWCKETQNFEEVTTPKGNKYLYRPLSNSVFLDSATAIEACRLNGDDPELPTSLDGIEPLSDLKCNVLEALMELGANGPNERRTADEIAERVEGSDFEINKFKRPLAELVLDSYIASKGGRGGGYWLIDKGKTFLAQQIKGAHH